MPKHLSNELHNKKIQNIKPGTKDLRLADGKGLFLFVPRKKEGQKDGSKLWRFRFLWEGGPQEISFGAYPRVSLEEARKKAEEARQQLHVGIRPYGIRKLPPPEETPAEFQPFGFYAEKWYLHERTQGGSKADEWSKTHDTDTRGRLDNHILPCLGNKPIIEVNQKAVVKALDGIRELVGGATLRKIIGIISGIIRHASYEVEGLIDFMPNLKGRYKTSKPKNRPHLQDLAELGELMRKISEYRKVNILTASAMRLSALTLLRPGEIAGGRWSEIKFDLPDPNTWKWEIPGERMKNGRDHWVPIVRQIRELLEGLKPISGHSGFLFPSFRTKSGHLNESTVNCALKDMGYKDRHCAHGFRHTGSTILNSRREINKDWVRFQLSHTAETVLGKVEATYNQGDYEEDRFPMMRWWADALDCLENDEPLPEVRPYFEKRESI